MKQTQLILKGHSHFSIEVTPGEIDKCTQLLQINVTVHLQLKNVLYSGLSLLFLYCCSSAIYLWYSCCNISLAPFCFPFRYIKKICVGKEQSPRLGERIRENANFIHSFPIPSPIINISILSRIYLYLSMTSQCPPFAHSLTFFI